MKTALAVYILRGPIRYLDGCRRWSTSQLP